MQLTGLHIISRPMMDQLKASDKVSLASDDWNNDKCVHEFKKTHFFKSLTTYLCMFPIDYDAPTVAISFLYLLLQHT